MLVITKNDQSEPIVDYKDFFIEEEVNGALILNATIINSEKNEHGYKLIEEESIVEYEGHEYRIKGLKDNRLRKIITAPHTFFELSGEQKHDIYGGTRTADEIFGWLLNGTGWTYEIVDSFPSTLFPNFGEDNALSLIWQSCKILDCEIKIERNKHLEIYHRIGEDNDFQFRYGYNIKTFSRDVDTTNLRTSIKGYGANGLEVTYTSPHAEKFPHAGEADPVHDDRFTVVDNLIERIKRDLIDYPQVTIEILELDLGESKGLGDGVWLIYDPLDIEFRTRIVARKQYPHALHKNTVTLGTPKQTFTDLLTEQNIKVDENNKQVQSRIDQTNDRITLEVEEIDGVLAGIDITVGQIQSYVTGEVIRLDGEIATSNSLITQTASSIRTEVNTEITRVDGRIDSSNSSITQTASSIRSEVNSEVNRLDGRVDSANSSITQTASSIRSEVSSAVTRLDGRVDSANSVISQQSSLISTKVTAGEASSIFYQNANSFNFEASQINFLGHVFGQGATFSGNIETYQNATVGNNIYLGDQLLDGVEKSIIFNRGARIMGGGPYNFGATLIFSADAYNYSGGATHDFGYNSTFNFNNATITGFNVPSHTHGDSYIKSYTGQDISLTVTDTGIVVRLNGVSKSILWG